ncbi:MAG: hypothetical protein AAF456_15310 [Planctomycetota bacterium]
MRSMLAISASLLLFAVGCAVPGYMNRGPINQQTIVSTIDQPVHPGNTYEIAVRMNAAEENQIFYSGMVVTATDESVTLADAVERVVVVSSPPIPLIGSLFVNKSSGRAPLDRPITIRRDEIVGVRALSTQ